MTTRTNIIGLGDRLNQDAITQAQAIIRARRLKLREEEAREARLQSGLSQFGTGIRELALAHTRRCIAELRSSI
jgi:hypothetical protein